MMATTRKMKASNIRIGDFLYLSDGTHGVVDTIAHVGTAHADFTFKDGEIVRGVTLCIGHPTFPFEDLVFVLR